MLPDKCVMLNNRTMKKVFLILFVGVLGVWVSQQTLDSPIMNDVFLENVEALAEMEVPGPTICWASGELTCPGNGKKVGEVYQGYSLR